MKKNLLEIARRAADELPGVKAYLSPAARYALHTPAAYKSQEYMLDQIEGLVTSLYNNQIGGEFIDVMANVISGQLFDAYSKAWFDYGETGALPEYLNDAYQASVLNQYSFVDQYFRDIIDARIDGTPLSPLLSRAGMWANRWNESYNDAAALITAENGGNMVWEYGEAEHCETCRALNGIVASANEWGIAGVKPQNAPNPLIDCGGWQCKCSLTPTDKRRSPKALDTILNIVGK
jgi:hypothetical protein